MGEGEAREGAAQVQGQILPLHNFFYSFFNMDTFGIRLDS